MLGLVSPALRRRIMDAAESIAHPAPRESWRLPSVAEDDPFYGVELRFLARTASGRKYGYAQIVTAHALVQSEVDVLSLVEDEAIHKIRRAVETEAGDVVRLFDNAEALLVSHKGKRLPI